MFIVILGAQLLSGRVLDSRSKGRGFEPHRRHCVLVFEQDSFLVQPRKTRPYITEGLLMDVKNQIKQTIIVLLKVNIPQYKNKDLNDKW